MNLPKILALAAIAVAAAILLINSTAITESESTSEVFDNHQVYELRTYTTHEGKLDDLHTRFADHTMALFEKHGMVNIGYWTPTDQENTLIYILSHESREAAEASWQAFGSDPEWQEVYQASREDGPLIENIVSVYMTSTEFSPMK